MYALAGEFECKLDEKGRLRLPSQLIRQIGGSGSLTFVVNRGFEQCLMLYPKDVWDQKSEEVNQLNIYNAKHRNFIRYFYRGATSLTLDSADRILLPKSLMAYAGLDRDAMLFAYHQQVEIWSRANYEEMLAKEPSEFSALAEEVFGSKGLDQEAQ